MILLTSFAFIGCKEKKELKISSEDTIEIKPHETSENYKKESLWTDEDGVVCVLLGYGFNDEETSSKCIQALKDKFGLAENGGLVLPIIYPNDLHNRIANFKEIIDKNNVRGIVLLGAPERTHYTLAKILEDRDENPLFAIFSLFPQDDILGQESTCDFVLDYAAASGVQFGDMQQKNDDESLDILLSAVEYIALLPPSTFKGSELRLHVQSIVGSKRVLRYIDSESGIQSRNHFVIESVK